MIPMEMNVYQNRAVLNALPICKSELFYNVLGLCGESGEVAEKIKKIYRDRDGIVTETDRDSIVKELGDVLWYLANIARFLNVDLDDVARINIEKCEARRETNTLHGEGDNREEIPETRTVVPKFGDFQTGDYVQVVGSFMTQGKRGHIMEILETPDNVFFQIMDEETGKVFEVWNKDSIILVESIVKTGTTYPKAEDSGSVPLLKHFEPIDPLHDIMAGIKKQEEWENKTADLREKTKLKRLETKEKEPLLFDLVYIEEQANEKYNFVGRKGVLIGSEYIDEKPIYYVQPRCESMAIPCTQVRVVPDLAIEEDKNNPETPQLGDAVIVSTFSCNSKYNGRVGTLIDIHTFEYMQTNFPGVLESPEWSLPLDGTIRPDAYLVRLIDGSEHYFPSAHKLEQDNPEQVRVNDSFTRGDRATVHLPVPNEYDGKTAIVISGAKVNGKRDGYIVRDTANTHCFWAKMIS